MRNILKDIDRNCKDCSTTEKVLNFLFNSGDIPATSEYHREIYFFYIETLDTFPNGRNRKKLARQETCQMFRISEDTLRKIITKYRRKYK